MTAGPAMPSSFNSGGWSNLLFPVP